MKFRTVLTRTVIARSTVMFGVAVILSGTVLPVAAIAAPAAAATPATPAVLDAGYLQIAPLVKAFEGNPGRVESFTPGLAVNRVPWLDAEGNKDFSQQSFVAADQAIVHLSAQDQSSSGSYQTPATENYLASNALIGSQQNGSSYVGSGRLLLGTGTLVGKGADKNSSELNARGETIRDFSGSNSANVLSLRKVVAPEGGKVSLTGKAAGAAVTVESTGLTQGGSATSLAPPASLELGVTSSLATEFTLPGRYCLTIEQSIKSKQGGLLSATGTYTFYVGALPAKPALCGGSPTDPGTSDPDPDTVKVIGQGHLDVRAPLSGDGRSLQLQVATSQQRVPFKDLVLTGVRSGKIPTATAQQNFGLVGAAGSPYWYYGQSEADLAHHLWPGFSGEDFAPSDLSFGFQDASLTRVLGPAGGHFAMFFNDAVTDRLRPDAVYFDSRQGMPQSYPIGAASHNHFNWTFSQPGKYCLAFEAKAGMSSGSWVSDAAQLTIWVGDPALASQQIPCDRSEGTKGLSLLSHPKVAPAPDASKSVLRSGLVALEPLLSSSGLGLNARLQSSTVSPVKDASATALILSSGLLSGGRYLFEAGDADAAPALLLDSGRIAPSTLSGLMGLSFGQIRGPGTVELLRGQTPVLSSNPASGLQQTSLAAQSRDNSLRWSFDQPGVYCVPLNVSAQRPGTSQALSSSTLLTFVLGSETPGAPDYLDRGKLKPCAQGGSASKPGDVVKPGGKDGSPAGQKPVGVTVLSEGHVDLASRLGGRGLTTQIKDSSRGPVQYRDPAKTVLQVKNAAKHTIRSGSSFGFLGASGAQVYVLGQTQEAGLLWPGWSTEEVPQLGPVGWTLTRLGTVGSSGPAPGDFAMYQLSDLGQAEIKFNSASGVNQFTIPAGVHQHGSWAFSTPGVYCTAFHRSAANGQSSDFTVTWVVGEHIDPSGVDPARCFAGEKVHGLPKSIKTADSSGPSAAAPGGSKPQPPLACLAGDAGGAAQALPPGAVVLDQGHVDFASRIVDGKLRSQIKDGTSSAVQWREPSDTVIKLKPEAKITLPGGAFDFLGAAGSQVYQIPQTQRPGLVWLGWNTEELGLGQVSSPVSWTLDAVNGPGQVHIFELSAFGSPIQVLSAGGSYQIPLGTHAHGNWAFSAPGIYRLSMTQSAVLSGGERVSDHQTLTVLVGDAPAAASSEKGKQGETQQGNTKQKAQQTACPPDAAAKKPPQKPSSNKLPMLGQATVPWVDQQEVSETGWPLWLWVVLGAGVLLAGAGLGTGGTIWVLRKK
ncbi:TIGR03773 family transporter-associated surface protein [Psychromicrobium sp. YIM B11713]|uniref:TIGR03773 family transporter-associated surface protein n=1 Tax=Psychromicrobium sp. YIM B11713 TaxID=3145233 RepID=UPI00374ECD4B